MADCVSLAAIVQGWADKAGVDCREMAIRSAALLDLPHFQPVRWFYRAYEHTSAQAAERLRSFAAGTPQGHEAGRIFLRILEAPREAFTRACRAAGVAPPDVILLPREQGDWLFIQAQRFPPARAWEPETIEDAPATAEERAAILGSVMEALERTIQADKAARAAREAEEERLFDESRRAAYARRGAPELMSIREPRRERPPTSRRGRPTLHDWHPVLDYVRKRLRTDHALGTALLCAEIFERFPQLVADDRTVEKKIAEQRLKMGA